MIENYLNEKVKIFTPIKNLFKKSGKVGINTIKTAASLSNQGYKKGKEYVDDVLYIKNRDNLIKQRQREQNCQSLKNDQLDKLYCLRNHYDTTIKETMAEFVLARKYNRSQESTQLLKKIQDFKNKQINTTNKINQLEIDENNDENFNNNGVSGDFLKFKPEDYNLEKLKFYDE